MKVLIACEFSGIVRDAFYERGHDAWSCDLLPSERLGNHIQSDVLDIIDNSWDLMIAHPPCTYLSNVGNAWLKLPERLDLREKAKHFFMELFNSKINKICVENPVGHMNTAFRKPNQIINPFQFGHPERKKTCLWLKNLPKLKPTKEVKPQEPFKTTYKNGRKRNYYFIDWQIPGKDRWMIRSRTFQGIADAMAEQWG